MCTWGQVFQGLSVCLPWGVGVSPSRHVCPCASAHLGCVHALAPLGSFSASALDTHVFPIQAWLAIIARLSLQEQIIGQKAGLR